MYSIAMEVLEFVIFVHVDAQNERSLSLTSSATFGVNPAPSLCSGSMLNFTCIAINFPFVDWLKNGNIVEQYTPTSMPMVNLTNPQLQASIVLNSISVTDALSADFNTTLFVRVNEGVSSGDIIRCGNELLNFTSELIVQYTTVRKSIL